MAEPVSLDEAKLHLRVVGADEDTLIAACIAAARNHCENELGIGLSDAGATLPGETVVEIPATVRSAILLMVGFLYQCRDADAKQVPGAVAAMLNLSPYRYRRGVA